MRVVVLTGSGVSAESGVATFRDRDGIWSKYDYREVATPEGFAADPALVHGFYNARRRALQTVAPNAAHAALAKLEEELAARAGVLTLITQNVDDLHERAGSKNLLHMHGELGKARCGACGDIYLCKDDLGVSSKCAACGQVGAMRPHVVWFGEMPMFMDEIADAVTAADLFVSIGTSGSVYPAAGFPRLAKENGAGLVILNRDPTDLDRFADLVLNAEIGPTLGAAVNVN